MPCLSRRASSPRPQQKDAGTESSSRIPRFWGTSRVRTSPHFSPSPSSPNHADLPVTATLWSVRGEIRLAAAVCWSEARRGRGDVVCDSRHCSMLLRTFSSVILPSSTLSIATSNFSNGHIASRTKDHANFWCMISGSVANVSIVISCTITNFTVWITYSHASHQS